MIINVYLLLASPYRREAPCSECWPWNKHNPTQILLQAYRTQATCRWQTFNWGKQCHDIRAQDTRRLQHLVPRNYLTLTVRTVVVKSSSRVSVRNNIHDITGHQTAASLKRRKRSFWVVPVLSVDAPSEKHSNRGAEWEPSKYKRTQHWTKNTYIGPKHSKANCDFNETRKWTIKADLFV
jgi:uncharacterized protein YpbB